MAALKAKFRKSAGKRKIYYFPKGKAKQTAAYIKGGNEHDNMPLAKIQVESCRFPESTSKGEKGNCGVVNLKRCCG